MTQANKQQELNELFEETVTLKDCIDVPALADFSSEDELRDYIQDRISEYDLIYYARAIGYLKDNDPSLRDSLDAAIEYGYSMDNLTSEILATLLIQRYMSEELSELDFSGLFDTDED